MFLWKDGDSLSKGYNLQRVGCMVVLTSDLQQPTGQRQLHKGSLETINDFLFVCLHAQCCINDKIKLPV